MRFKKTFSFQLEHNLWPAVVFSLLLNLCCYIGVSLYLIVRMHNIHTWHKLRICAVMLKMKKHTKKTYAPWSWPFGRSFIKIVLRDSYLMAQIIDDDTGYTSAIFILFCVLFPFHHHTDDALIFLSTEKLIKIRPKCLWNEVAAIDRSGQKKGNTYQT